MSASKEKRTRNEQRVDGIDKRTSAEIEAAKNKKKFRCKAIIAIVLVIVIIAGAVFINSNVLYTKVAAVKIGDTSYSAAELGYYYKTIYSNYSDQYGDYITLFFDPTVALSEQQYSEEQTWEDYFLDLAIQQMTQVTALYDDAMKNGFVIDDELQATIDNYVSYSQLYASVNNLSPDAYLALSYGKGMNQELYRSIVEKGVVADTYSTQVKAGYEFTNDELKAYYSENANSLDSFTYHYFYVNTSLEAFSDLDEEGKKTAAHNAAANIAAAETEEDFTAAVQALVGEDQKETYSTVDSTRTTVLGSTISSYYNEWVTDPARKTLETTVVDSDYGSYAVMYVSRDGNEYTTKNVRHILIEAEADDNGEYTDEALAAAKTKAEEIYAEWKTNPTEDNFAALATENSDDAGSYQNGGLYENVNKGDTVEEFDAFCYAEDRKPGDTDLIYGTNGSYAGYHIVYFVGEGKPYCDIQADNGLRSDAYSTYLTALLDTYTVTRESALRYADLNVKQNAQ